MSKVKTSKEKLYEVIKKPVISEKAMAKTQISQYTFEVSPDATKDQIAKAVEEAYKGRKVKKVRTIYVPSHAKRMGLKYGQTTSGKKAVVTIEGEPIAELTGV